MGAPPGRASYTCKFILKLRQRDKQITFLSEVYENTCENQAKSADFSANFSLKIPWNSTFFSATYQKPCPINAYVFVKMVY